MPPPARGSTALEQGIGHSRPHPRAANLVAVGLITAAGFATVYIARQSQVGTGSLSYAAIFLAVFLVAHRRDAPHAAARGSVPPPDGGAPGGDRADGDLPDPAALRVHQGLWVMIGALSSP